MNEHPENKTDLDEDAARSGYREHAPAQEQQGAEGAPDGEASEEDVLLRLAAENEELKDRALRLAAEMENLRRRTARDVHDARNYAIAAFARDMLAVSDNLQRALEAIPEEAKKRGDPGFKALIDGVEMTERDMLGALERHGVKKIAAEGEKFDPNFHQAMFEVPNPDVPANTVVQVMQAGYAIGERVLRPAMVGVAKGGPKQAADGDGANGEPPAEPGPPDPRAEKDA
jgi:molecular chaperone GrpE